MTDKTIGQAGSVMIIVLLLLSLVSVTPLASADDIIPGEGNPFDHNDDSGNGDDGSQPGDPTGEGSGSFTLDAGGPYVSEEGTPIIFEGSALSIFFTTGSALVADPADQGNISIKSGHSIDADGNYIVYQDKRNGNWDIFLFDTAIGVETPITSNTANDLRPAIDVADDGTVRIVYDSVRTGGGGDIYLYEFEQLSGPASGTETRITTNTAGQFYADIHGDIIAWYDWRNQGEVQNPPSGAENTEIYVYDIGTGEEIRVTSGPDHTKQDVYARVSGNTIVYQSQDPVHVNWVLRVYDITTGDDTVLNPFWNNQFPDIEGDTVVFQRVTNDGHWNIFTHDLDSGQETQITETNGRDAWYPRIEGDKIVWEDNRNDNQTGAPNCFEDIPGYPRENVNCDIFVYDIDAALEYQITQDDNGQFQPAVSDDVIAWIDNRNGNLDVFSATFDASDDFTLEWDFDYDGVRFDTQATGKTVSYTYTDDFVGQAAVRATDATGTQYIATADVTVDNVPPIADIGGPYSGVEGTAITFDASGSADSGVDDTLTYTWVFADTPGSIVTTNTTLLGYTFAADGSYAVTLTVTDDDGGSDTETTTATIDDVDPVAEFGIGISVSLPSQIGDDDGSDDDLEPTENSGQGGSPDIIFTVVEDEPVQFLDFSVSVDGIVSWTWDFDDGTPLVFEQSPAHVFTEPGDYFVSLTVAEADGDTDTVVKGFTVLEDTTFPTITNVMTVPPFPFVNDGTEQEVTVDFESDDFPLTVSFDLLNQSGDLVDTQGPFDVENDNDLPLTYTISGDLPDGTYTLEMAAADLAGNTVTITLGNFDVRSAPVITDVTTDPPLPVAVLLGDEQDITVNFTSDRFPLAVTFNLWNDNGTVVHTQVHSDIAMQDDLPLTYTVPATLAIGDYTLEMVAQTVEAGGKTVVTLGMVFVVEGDFVLAFHEGWNLFSIPKEANESAVTSVLDGLRHNGILTYVDGQWVSVCGDTDNCGLQTIDPLFAYWIHLSEPAGRGVTFKVTTQGGVDPAERILIEGWNLAGVGSLVPRPSEELLISLVNSTNTTEQVPTYSEVFVFDGQEWIFHAVDTEPDVTVLPGKGLWIFMKEEDTLATQAF